MADDVTGKQEGIIKGGDVDVISVELFSSHHKDSFKLGNIWKNISIFENMQKNYIEGEITITETQALLEFIPIITNEKIIIKFITPSATEPYVFVGHIHQIPSRIQISQGQQVYVLGFISPEFIKNQKIQFSKAYNKSLISDMVENIYDQYIRGVTGKRLTVMSTTDQTSRVVPTMSPFKAINWLTKWSVSPSYRDGASYVFFENQTGYYYGPIEALVDSSINKKPAATYNKEIVLAQEGKQKEVGRAYRSISDVEAFTPKYLPGVVSGVYASKAKTHDIVLRQIGDSTRNYFQSYSSTKHLESSDENTMLHNDTSLGEYFDSFVQYIPDHYLAHSEQPSSRTTSTSLTRTSQLKQFFSKKLNITVPGDSDRTVGEVVQINLPSASPVLDETFGDKDKYLSGRYLITGLRHSLEKSAEKNKTTHTLHMELSSDSYASPLPEQTVHHWA
jgi:hypothetical protein